MRINSGVYVSFRYGFSSAHPLDAQANLTSLFHFLAANPLRTPVLKSTCSSGRQSVQPGQPAPGTFRCLKAPGCGGIVQRDRSQRVVWRRVGLCVLLTAGSTAGEWCQRVRCGTYAPRSSDEAIWIALVVHPVRTAAKCCLQPVEHMDIIRLLWHAFFICSLLVSYAKNTEQNPSNWSNSTT